MKTRGMGFVYQNTWKDEKTGEVKISPIWSICYSVNGKRIRESSQSENRADAVRLLKRQTGRAAVGLPVGPQLEKTTLDNLLAMIEDEYTANGRKSLERMKIAAVRLREFFGGARRASEITPAEITAYQGYRRQMVWRGRPIGPSTINYECAILRHALTLAEHAGKVAKRPYFAMLQVNNTRTGFFEREQLDAILRRLTLHLHPVALAAYMTGWRARSELLTRQWKHVDFLNGWLRLDPGETKNKEGRMFPFGVYPELRDLLMAQRSRVIEMEHRLGRVISWVFPKSDGSPIASYDYGWNKARRAAGLPASLMHDMRRTAVRNLERAGVSRSAAMKLTGHETESVYQRYAIVDSAMLEEAVAKVAKSQSRARVSALQDSEKAESPVNLRTFDA